MAAAMNHSDDLMQIAEAMFRELEILKINPLRYGLAIIQDDKTSAEIWASTVNDGHYMDMLGKIPLNWHPMLKQVLYAWDGQLEEFIYRLEGQELSLYYQKVGALNSHIPELDKLLDPDSGIVQYANFFPFKTGVLYAFTDGVPGEEGKSILKRFANVFEQAHIRYDDLQTAEMQAQLIRDERDRLEIALKELKATQTQLIQQEKLASLGQLTAGIAHEIKNPLNFVNNFSEVSIELLQEIRDEIEKIKTIEDSTVKDESLQEIGDLVNDIDSNLSKIHEHGTRADSIVKSMLQHSRGSDGKMEPTAINSLVKEFVNLSFHGMRASKSPINVDLAYELDESIGEMPLIAEDFSRVIVNLCNNAFDAMREKGEIRKREKSEGESYLPKLTVRTQQQADIIRIEIEDNGPGIPDEMKDKILQPFFTTKKGTQGTGLGLSITNDIIKAHRGSLHIFSEKNVVTCFSIDLPN
jgi:signal transduction histidine kinase